MVKVASGVGADVVAVVAGRVGVARRVEGGGLDGGEGGCNDGVVVEWPGFVPFRIGIFVGFVEISKNSGLKEQVGAYGGKV